MFKLYFSGFLVVLLLPACSSTPTKPTAENQPDVVVSRIDGLDERPDWLKEGEPFVISKGKVISLGSTTISSDSRIEAAQRIALNNAKSGIATAVEQRLEFIFQNAEEGTSLDSTQARYIGAEAASLVTSSMRPAKLYWEKIATTLDSGERVTRYKVFSTVEMPEEDFRRAILDAARRRQGKGGLSADFAKKVDQHWDSFVNPAESRSPASVQENKEQ